MVIVCGNTFWVSDGSGIDGLLTILSSSGGTTVLPTVSFQPDGLVFTDSGAGGGIQLGLLAGVGGGGRCGRVMVDFIMGVCVGTGGRSSTDEMELFRLLLFDDMGRGICSCTLTL